MKFLSRAFFLVFVLVGALVAVSNRQPVELTLWPLPQVLIVPLYLLIVGLLLVGALGGLSLGWWAARHHRRRARERGSEAARLDREVTRLRDSLAANETSPVSSRPRPREQKAIERQTALVAPQPFD
jgi:uncharacterized integral membrane protein